MIQIGKFNSRIFKIIVYGVVHAQGKSAPVGDIVIVIYRDIIPLSGNEVIGSDGQVAVSAGIASAGHFCI